MKLPAFFDTKVTKAEVNKDRIRIKEHVHGNWPTIIYIPINLKTNDNDAKDEDDEGGGGGEELLNRIKSEFKDFELFQIDPLNPECPFHLSLSRTLYVKDHQKELFKAKMEEALKSKEIPEKLKFEKVEIYLNDEMTRTFIAIDFENDERIFKLIESIDKILKDFGLPIYYKPPKLHFSLFWCKGNQKESLRKFLIEEINLKGFEVEIDAIFIKCGNRTHEIARDN